ncbi:MAG: DMT family transporter, partial [Geminicoccaceae bacterium]
MSPQPKFGDGFRSLPPMAQAGALLVVGATCVAIQNGMIRQVSTDIHTFEIVFFRNLFGLLVMLPFLARIGPNMLRSKKPGSLMLMSGCHLLGMVCYF